MNCKWYNVVFVWSEYHNFDDVIKKLLRNFEVSGGHFFKKLWGLNAEVVSYKKNECTPFKNGIAGQGILEKALSRVKNAHAQNI